MTKHLELMRKKILTIFGTRPEAIKLAPIIVALKKHPTICSTVCITAQHRQMLDQVLGLFDIEPDIDLDLMKPDQSLAQLTGNVVVGVDRVLEREKPDLVLVQGDTTTVMATSMVAFYRGIKVGHVEAGLRSGNLYSPFPEEMNRRVVGILGHLHFAPTQNAANALLREGVSAEQIFLTGNPVIDALQMIIRKPLPKTAEDLLQRAGIRSADDDPKLILVTAHRRENFGERLEGICGGLKALVERNKDIVIIFPVHLNPNVQKPVKSMLRDSERIILTGPVDYDVLAHLMKVSHVVLTDSGGIQEEAPSLGKPVLVMRTETERPEGIEAGTAKLVGPFTEAIVAETEALLRNKSLYQKMAKAVNPYGDGHAAERIVDILLRISPAQ